MTDGCPDLVTARNRVVLDFDCAQCPRGELG